MKKLALNILFLLCTSMSWSQNFVINKITTGDGLSQNDVNAIHQDKNGFLWVGTNDGLNRFDGYNFKTYLTDPTRIEAISSNLIYRIAEDKTGNLWLATSDEGVCKFNIKTEKFTSIKNTEDNPSLLNSNQIVCIAISEENTIWVGSHHGIDIIKHNGQVYEIEKINNINLPGLASNYINDIVPDEHNRKWIATKNGLFIIEEIDQTRTIKQIGNYDNVYDICISTNNIFITSSKGIFKLSYNGVDLGDLKSYHISNQLATCILVSKTGTLYAGTNNGLTLFENSIGNITSNNSDHSTEKWKSQNISNSIVESLYEDKSGIIWIGTNGNGLNKYNPKQKRFRHFQKTDTNGSLSSNKVRAIYEDREKNIWIGTTGGGINFLPYQENRNYESGFISLNRNPNSNQNRTYSFVDLNKSGKIELLAGSGFSSFINKIEVVNNKPTMTDEGILDDITSRPFAMLNDSNGNIWIGTYGLSGLYKYTKNKNIETITNYKADGTIGSLSSNNIRSLLEDDFGNIWIGTDKGLNLLKPNEQKQNHPKFILFQKNIYDSTSISHNYILPIFQGNDKTIWVGTMGGGLNKILYHSNPDSIKFQTISTSNGLPNNVIKGIVEDDYGFLWISSNKGLTKYNPDNNSLVTYDKSDGLQDYEFGELAYCKLHDGELLFGGVNGFNAFYPNDIVIDTSLPIVALTDFQILNQSISAGDKFNGKVIIENVINHTENIKLRYSENSFAFYFSSLHFSSPGKNAYKYTLEGFDNGWINKDANERKANYTNIPPGKYIFKILSSNSDGIWAKEPKIVEITITPPWWSSNLAFATYGLLFVLFMWFIQRYSIIRNQRKNELLMEHFEKEKVQELSQMKFRFFTNISHEFRTPLTLIMGPLEKLIKNRDSLSDKKIEENFNIMHRNASILMRLINQLIDFRKFEQGKMKLQASNSNIVSFLSEVFLSFRELAESKNITYNFSSSKEKINIWFDKEKVERIMYNLLSNAFKFTPKGGKIKIIIDEDDFRIIIKIIDNGVGIPEDMQEHIFERFYQAKQIKSPKAGSAGIGLSFIKGLVEMHKGEINFKSKEGQGTTFFVHLLKGDTHLSIDQLCSQEPNDELSIDDYILPETNDSLYEDDIEDNIGKQSILVVEDNLELRNFLKESLSENYKVILAENGKEGFELLQNLNPEIIISDISMPVMDGFELCKTIKTDEKTSHIPIILLTAKTTSENRVKGYDLGADGYISKPFSIEVLESRIKNLIESREKLQKKLRKSILVEPSQVTNTSMDEQFLKKILSIIENNISNPDFTVEQLARDYGMSQMVLNRKLKGLSGQTARLFIRTIRLKRAAQLFKTGKYSVSEVTYEVGFSDLKHFRNCFKDEFNLTPTDFIRKSKTE